MRVWHWIEKDRKSSRKIDKDHRKSDPLLNGKIWTLSENDDGDDVLLRYLLCL